MLGTYALRNNLLDIAIMLGLGVAGFLLRGLGIGAAPIVLGLILGTIAEQGYVQTILGGMALPVPPPPTPPPPPSAGPAVHQPAEPDHHRAHCRRPVVELRAGASAPCARAAPGGVSAMQIRINTDLASGILGLVLAGLFWSQRAASAS